jgi:hypothetical protein
MGINLQLSKLKILDSRLRQAYLAGQRQTCTEGRREESNFRIEIFEINGHGQKGELGKQLPELVLLSVPINLEYLYAYIRFSTPGSAPSVNQLIHGVDHACQLMTCNHARSHARNSSFCCC